jgi:hypothetical protein
MKKQEAMAAAAVNEKEKEEKGVKRKQEELESGPGADGGEKEAEEAGDDREVAQEGVEGDGDKPKSKYKRPQIRRKVAPPQNPPPTS